MGSGSSFTGRYVPNVLQIPLRYLTLLGLALQISESNIGHGHSTVLMDTTTSQMYAACYDLLRMSSGEAAFIDIAYPILSEVHRVLSLVLRQKSLFPKHERIRQLLDQFMLAVLNVMNENVTYSPDAVSRTHSGRLFRTSVGIIHGLKDQLIDQFWLCQLSPDAVGAKESKEQVSAIRQWLWPYDVMVRAMYANLYVARSMHAQFTCEWFSKPMLDFIRSSDKALWIEGAAGCGKSMLCGWIVESLQNPVGGQTFAVLSHVVDPILSSEILVSCLLKGLLRQAYEQNPGQRSLQTALAKAQDTAVTSECPGADINALWEAFEIVCEATPRQSMIVIDGLSELSGDDGLVTECLKRLLDSISKSPMIRLLLLSRSLVQPPDIVTRRFAINSSHNHQDIRRVLEQIVPTGSSGQTQGAITWILNRASGNFLWCILAFRYWRSKQDNDRPVQVESLPRSLDATLSVIISGIAFASPSVRLLLLASVVAARPLSVAEVQSLLNIDLVNRTCIRQDLDIRNLIDQNCESVMVIENDMIQFRHHLVKQAVCEHAERKLRSSLNDIHIELASRLLLYLRLTDTPHVELSLAPIASAIVEELLRSNPLLAYALQYWTYHTVQAGSVDDLSSLSSVSEVREIFPDTVFVAAFEASYWTIQAPDIALPNLRLAAQVRRDILGNHSATLQSSASLAVQLRSANQLLEAASYFALAFELSQQIMPGFHTFSADCASEFLGSLYSISQSASTDFHVRKCTMLLYLRAMYTNQSGPSSDQALKYSHRVGRHYAETDQESLCTQTYREIYKLTVDRYGKSSPQAMAVAGQLVTVLEKSQRQEGQDEFDDVVYDSVMDMFAVTDSRRIKASIMKAAVYRSQNDPSNAELVYLELLHEVTGSCRERHASEDQVHLLKIGLLYAGFLADQSREEDAQIVLVGLWASLEKHCGKSATEIQLLRTLAVETRQRGLPAVALTILNSVSDWSRVHTVDPSDSEDVDVMISQFASELISSNESGRMLPKSTEEVLMLTFESAKLGGAPAFTESLIQIIQTLVDSFTLQQRWHEVVQVASSTLYIVWPEVLETRSERSLDGFLPPMGDIAVSLAKAYSKIDQGAIAGHIYLHVLRSAKRSAQQDPRFIIAIARAARQTFEDNGRSSEMISVEQELVDHYRASLGDEDPLTVEATYALASLCTKHGEYKIAKTCYMTIADNFKRSTYHDRHAIPALNAMLVILLREKNWVQAKEIYHSLWQTFLEKGKEYSAREETVRSLFKGYSQLLENHMRIDPEALHQIREEYHTGCANVFGRQASITLEALLCLAKSWDRLERDSPNAIHIYESIVDDQANDGLPSHHEVLEILDWVEAALLEHYRSRLDDVMDEHTLARATNLQRKQFHRDEAQFQCYSPTSLSSLATYVQFLTKENSPESRNAAVQELNKAVDSVLQLDCEGKVFFDAGTLLASSFVDCGYATEGYSTAHRIRENIIVREERDRLLHEEESRRMSDRSRLTFSAAFETRIKGSMEEFTSIYSITLLETTLWESFQALIQASSPLELILARGTRLQALLKSRHSSYRGEKLEKQMLDRFLQSYGAAFTTSAHATRMFFLVLIQKMGEVRADTVLPELACVAVSEETQRLLAVGEYSKVAEFATAGFDFIRFIGAYGDRSYVQYGFQLGLLLGDHSTRLSSHHVSGAQLHELSKMVFREVIRLCRTSNLGFDDMDLDELSKVAAVLGKQQNYHDLEVIISIHETLSNTNPDSGS